MAQAVYALFSKYRYPIILVAAILCAVAAVFLAKSYLDMKEREIRSEMAAKQRLTQVVVAKMDLPVGSEISPKTMSARSVPSDYIPDGAITPEVFSSVEGMAISEPISQGKMLLRHNIKNITRVEKFSDLLAKGERAVTLDVDGRSSAEYMLEAGDLIDIAVREKESGEFTPLLEKVIVLATGKVTTADPKLPGMYKKAEYETITIGVESSKVAMVLAADSRRELVYLLRNDGDKDRSKYLSSSQNRIEVILGKKSKEGALESVEEKISSGVVASREKRNKEGHLLRRAVFGENILSMKE